MKRTIALLAAFAGMFLGAGAPNAQAHDCSNASLHGAYGFFVSAIFVPDGTPRANLGRIVFDGDGNWSLALTANNNGTVIHLEDSGTYTVAADCTGQVFPKEGGAFEFVLVDNGKELYELRTDDASILFRYFMAKKQFPDEDEQGQPANMRKNSR